MFLIFYFIFSSSIFQIFNLSSSFCFPPWLSVCVGGGGGLQYSCYNTIFLRVRLLLEERVGISLVRLENNQMSDEQMSEEQMSDDQMSDKQMSDKQMGDEKWAMRIWAMMINQR